MYVHALYAGRVLQEENTSDGSSTREVIDLSTRFEYIRHRGNRGLGVVVLQSTRKTTKKQIHDNSTQQQHPQTTHNRS